MNKTAFVIFEDDHCEPDMPPSIIGICSTREKADRALAVLNAHQKSEYISYNWEEYSLDQLTIFL